ncbi:uncharacterized protein BBOV_I003270 [Babesia bovis T2Bo]|uniref:Membrane protein, putative n=1 Tax=Babesia bovis TaxID=5865 RepID=A7AWI1_BABBO|nr:uncharacterized protein BBOV_I003270 [Babesia bovis T2Bo]EDO05409.1 putative integral membrane protein [Babesia bovis T2Bo]BAN66204.1 membrane protein, putative [Babesia bovis]|eukprot:XP_001608977.1 hypothetical protein [Babesia bovis T2Bo]
MKAHVAFIVFLTSVYYKFTVCEELFLPNDDVLSDFPSYSYFLENELDDEYERDNEDSVYELMSNDGFGKYSLMDVAEDEDEPNHSFLEVDDEYDALDDDNAVFFQTESMDVDDKFLGDEDEKFDDVIFLDDDVIEPQHSSYQPIKPRGTTVTCVDNECTMNRPEAKDAKKDGEKEGEEQPPKRTFFNHTHSAILGMLLLGILVATWYILYTKGYLTALKNRVCGIFRRAEAYESVLPETSESDPLVAH